MLRLKKFIIPVIVVLMVALLAGCDECSWLYKNRFNQINDQNISGSIESIDTSADTEINTDDADDNLKNANKHGVLPTIVTISGGATGQSDYYYQWLIEFTNVGKLGGERCAEATMRIWYPDAPKDFQASVGDWGGYFTGGPNGDIYLTLIKGINASPKLHYKLKDGKELITDDGGIMKIDNPEAFDGWID